jgi:hypothetical protein
VLKRSHCRQPDRATPRCRRTKAIVRGRSSRTPEIRRSLECARRSARGRIETIAKSPTRSREASRRNTKSDRATTGAVLPGWANGVGEQRLSGHSRSVSPEQPSIPRHPRDTAARRTSGGRSEPPRPGLGHQLVVNELHLRVQLLARGPATRPSSRTLASQAFPHLARIRTPVPPVNCCTSSAVISMSRLSRSVAP